MMIKPGSNACACEPGYYATTYSSCESKRYIFLNLFK